MAILAILSKCYAIFQKIPGLPDPVSTDRLTKPQLLKAIDMKLRESGWKPAAFQADTEAEVEMEAAASRAEARRHAEIERQAAAAQALNMTHQVNKVLRGCLATS